MTQHVRRRYGNHRRGVWAAAVVLAVLSAAAVVPLATGAPPKHYTLTATPDTVCFTGAGQPQPFELTLTNQSTNTSLGSANITAPSFITLTAVTGAPSGSAFDDSTIMLRNLNLSSRGGSITLDVAATVTAPGTGAWASVAKQSNDFADAGPGNLLSPQGDPPPLTVTETCGGGGDEFVECNANDEGCTDGTTTLLSTIPLLVRFESPDTATCGGTTLTFISQQTFIPDPDDGAFEVTFTYDASISPKQVGATRFCVSKDPDGAIFQQLLGCEGDQPRLPCVLDRGKDSGDLFYTVSFPAGDPKVGMG